MSRRFNSEALAIPTADNTAGTPLVKPGHSDQAVQSSGTYTGGTSIKVQWTLDGVNWTDSGAAIVAANEIRTVPNYATQVRCFMTTKGTGVPTLQWAGYEELWP